VLGAPPPPLLPPELPEADAPLLELDEDELLDIEE
jgi:hypothetical protein